MTEIQNSKQYDLEERTMAYAASVRKFVKSVPRTPINQNDLIQLLRSSGSVGANYIEANESISRKDFVHRVKICRKEVKESIYWLKLLDVANNQLNQERNRLINEATELMKIFGSIIEKSK